MLARSGICRSQISEPEPVPFDDLTYSHGYVRAKIWEAVTKRVKLAPLTARVNSGWQFCQQVGAPRR